MSNLKYHLRSMLLTALGYGFGFAVGNAVSHLILNSGLMEPIRDLFTGQRLTLGIGLLLVVVGFGGAIGGAIGGLTLSYAHQSTRRLGYAWRSGLSFGVSYALILFPLTLAISLFSFYSPAKASPLGFVVVVGVAGAIFGVVSGLILGLLTVGRDTWRVFLVNTLGFALGGAGLGQGLYFYFFERAQAWSIFATLFLFGAIGGSALGFLYSWLAHRKPGKKPSHLARFIAWFRRSRAVYKVATVVVLLLALLVLRRLWVITPFKAQSASLASTLESKTTGTRWPAPVNVSDVSFDTVGQDSQPDVFVTETGAVALVWVREANRQSDIYYATELTDEAGVAVGWADPVNVSNSNSDAPAMPQIVVDSQGRAHIVWAEDSTILYSQCTGPSCTTPVRLSNLSGLNCAPAAGGHNSEPALAIDAGDTLLVTWSSDQQAVPYTLWPASDAPPETPTGCIPVDTGTGSEWTLQQPRLAGGANGLFGLAFAQVDSSGNSVVYLTRYNNGSWSSAPDVVGQGYAPEVYLDPAGQLHVAWCDDRLNYRAPGGQVEQIAFPGCTQRPKLVLDGSGVPRLVWYSNEVKNVNGVVRPNALLYESVRQADGWSEPVIIAQSNGPIQPALAAGGAALHLIWSDTPTGDLLYTTHTDYACDKATLPPIGRVVLAVTSQEKFRPASDIIPFCHNQYEGLVFAPNPLPAFSDETPTPNGAFDHLADLAKTARYEVVFSTMWYDKAENNDNPGSVLAAAIAELYRNLKENPARYPRGLTVRILLGNPPEFVLIPIFDHQIRHLLDDLRAAGIPEMSNPELGWKLEVANFDGSWPHSHTKLMVVDGKSILASGFNMQYSHFSEDHPSGLGQGRVDLGIRASGPVAQDSLLAFDDLWSGSAVITCSNFDPSSWLLWVFSCSSYPGTTEHVPEVLQYYLPEANNTAFSLHRTSKFQEADEAYLQALASAQSSIDTIQVNFTLEAVCDLNVLFEVCNYANRLDYMEAIMQAVETRRVKARVLIEQHPIDGLENRIAVKAFEQELEARGLSDLVKIRFFEGETHIKSALIDDEFLIIGSQNYHYSAWGDRGLTEYNLALDAPAAIEDYRKMFEYRWQNGVSVSEP